MVEPRLLRCIARSDAPVLIAGETGTGKTRLAHIIHEESGRDGAIVVVNLAAINPELIESELFGHERGAFTGGVSSRLGAFRTAHEGTILLDEIGEVPSHIQAKLLRVIESGRVRPVGSDREHEVDVRVIVATHSPGKLRDDLRHRLTWPIDMPALRDRDDLLDIAAALLPDGVTLSEDAHTALLEYEWPGNIRQLRAVLERAVALIPSLEMCPVVRRGVVLLALDTERVTESTPSAESVSTLDSAIRRHVAYALRVCGSVAEAARMLGVSRKTVRKYATT